MGIHCASCGRLIKHGRISPAMARALAWMGVVILGDPAAPEKVLCGECAAKGDHHLREAGAP